MKIKQSIIKVSELFDGYVNNEEEGVRGYHGLLNIRPAYQREFVYKDKQRNAVIDTITKGFPLGMMYWVKNEDGSYELLDGQQRTLSICEFLANGFSIKERAFCNMFPTEQNKILNYEIIVYICEGDEVEKLDWFRTINIAGEKLTDQELLNINYTGPWLTDAKKKFSKTNCVAYKLAEKYMKGSPIRQEYLETALDWISGGNITKYMSEHQHDPSATELWIYFQSVITWVNEVFTTYRKEMAGVPWGPIYDRCKNMIYTPAEIEKRVASLMEDDEVTKKSGIYEYIMDEDERHLSIRSFTPKMKRETYEKQGGICVKCGKHFEINEMQADHIQPWSKGGKTIIENCQLLCQKCNATKSNK